ncbi:MAG TPA: NIL domain-containing protein [Acidimicrobiales bacterium]|jgi:L-aspartate semialdehyde sulfurtransferase ferredoxin|nr:NIL domain-containing protein [Acidimicrobiales bacterium]
MSTVSVRVRLTFPESDVRRPVLATMVRRFDVEPNIRRADVEEQRGWIVCEVEGEAAQVEAALDWVRGEGITVDLLGDVLEG